MSGTPSGGGSKPRLTAEKLNPSQYGKPMQCHHCGSRTHFKRACPDLNGWTFVNYPHEDEIDAQYDNNHYQEENWEVGRNFSQEECYDNDGNLIQIPTKSSDNDTFIIDQVSGAAAILGREQERSNMNFYSTFDVLMAVEEQRGIPLSMEDALRKIIIDTGCIETVCGKDWLNDMLNTMDQETRRMVRVFSSKKIFRFGGGERKESLGQYILPISVGGTNIMLVTDCIDANLPCLLSKNAMIKANMTIDMKNNAIRMFDNKVISMDLIPSGHSVLNADPFIREKATEYFTMITLPEGERKELDSNKLKHIHEQLGHPGRHTLEIMLKNAGLFSNSVKVMINKLYENCATCFIHMKTKPKPKVAPPLSHDFNETICMDLKIWTKYGVIILYIIDTFSRFCQAHIIPNKKAESIIEPLLNSWILSQFGAPRNIIVDNGLEFVNSKMKDLCRNFNIRLFTTAAYSPYKNGLCEKNTK